MNKLGRRLGKFTISDPLFTKENEPLLTRLMGACVICRATHYFLEEFVEYTAYSFRFRELEEGEIIPTYQFFITDDGDFYCIERRGCHSARDRNPGAV